MHASYVSIDRIKRVWARIALETVVPALVVFAAGRALADLIGYAHLSSFSYALGFFSGLTGVAWYSLFARNTRLRSEITRIRRIRRERRMLG